MSSKEVAPRVVRNTKCIFYDDGHGNGSYCPGSCCGPPNCSLSKVSMIPNCNGDIENCSIHKGKNKAKQLNELINAYELQIKSLKATKI